MSLDLFVKFSLRLDANNDPYKYSDSDLNNHE